MNGDDEERTKEYMPMDIVDVRNRWQYTMYIVHSLYNVRSSFIRILLGIHNVQCAFIVQCAFTMYNVHSLCIHWSSDHHLYLFIISICPSSLFVHHLYSMVMYLYVNESNMTIVQCASPSIPEINNTSMNLIYSSLTYAYMTDEKRC